MPRRLDPEKGMPGLFARGGAGKDMEYLVQRRAAKTESRKLKRPGAPRGRRERVEAEPSARAIAVTETPGTDASVRVVHRIPVKEGGASSEETVVVVVDRALADAPPVRRVPELRADDGLGWAETPAMLACVVSWIRSAVTTR